MGFWMTRGGERVWVKTVSKTCPDCGSIEVGAYSIDPEDGAYLHACDACGHEWAADANGKVTKED